MDIPYGPIAHLGTVTTTTPMCIETCPATMAIAGTTAATAVTEVAQIAATDIRRHAAVTTGVHNGNVTSGIDPNC